MLGQKEPIKVQIFRLSTACTKINEIPYVIIQATSQFSFKFCITLQCHDTYFLWNFLAETLYALGRKSLSEYNSSDFSVPSWKFTQFLITFLHKVARSVFIQILHHYSVSWKITPLYFFSSNLIYFGQKEPIKVKFSDF